MIKPDVRIRAASSADADALLQIYAPYVERTAISFEYDVPSPSEFRARMERTLQRYPYLVAERDGELCGYAYTGAFVGRTAYDHAAEVTIYLRGDRRGLGLGRALYRALEKISRQQNILNIYACIGWPEVEDEYLTQNSAQFHAHMGYHTVGHFRRCGYKFGRWYDMIWMEKIIGAHDDRPMPVTPFPDLDAETLRKLGVMLAASR